jgi:RNA polymerase sigma factor (TIGR02999 family)
MTRGVYWRAAVAANLLVGGKKKLSYNLAPMTQATRLLQAINNGEAAAAQELLPLVYDELRKLARAKMNQERAGHTLEATALVHEAFLRLVGDEKSPWHGRGHFFAAAAEAMRRILIEHARMKAAIKHGGERQRVEFDQTAPIASPCDNVDDLLALDEALAKLESEYPLHGKLVKLLYFAGLSLEEAADALGLSKTTAHRHWTFARAWLFEAMKGR